MFHLPFTKYFYGVFCLSMHEMPSVGVFRVEKKSQTIGEHFRHSFYNIL